MARNLQDMKADQGALRDALMEYYLHKKYSILRISMEANVPYTSLRNFMHGGKINPRHIIKIEGFIYAKKGN